MTASKQVFISYAWKDGAALAKWLYERFNQSPNWTAWMDVELHADIMFSHELQRRIKNADLVLVVVSPEVNRENPPSFVQRELHYATQEEVNKPVFAVRTVKCEVPLIICGKTYLDFFEPSSYEAQFQALVAKINAGESRRRMTPQRDREMAYLESIARDKLNSFYNKVYVDMSAKTVIAPDPVEAAVDGADPDIAAFLTELAAAVYHEQQHTPDDHERHSKVESFEALTDALAQFERVAIIGDPGAGKSTTLRRFAYALAEAAKNDASAPLPVFVPLGGFEGGALSVYIERQMGGLGLHDLLPDRVAVLLDGLNETALENVAQVEKWLQAHPTVRVMLTCRKLDYVERKLDLQRVDVLPLDIKRIRQFIAAYGPTAASGDHLFWSLAGAALAEIWEKFKANKLTFDDFWFGKRLERGHPAFSSTTGDQDGLYNATREALAAGSYPALLGLARNPFLLTITIAIFHKERAVPRNRAELFARFVERLFADRGKPAAQQQHLRWVHEAVQRAALTKLAYAMQREDKGTQVERTWAAAIIAAALPGEDAEHLLYLAASAGILELGATVRFSHQLLQEYFAAGEMREDMRRGGAANRYFPSEQWWQPTGWEETALLLAGMAGDATEVVRWLTPVQPTLAYRCATESGAPCAEAVLQALYEPPTNARRSPIAVAAWGRLNHERDHRPGIGLLPDGLPDIVWCDVPAGKFLYGDEKQEREMPYSFKIAKYPITFIQFQAFLDSGEYDDPRWWEGMPEEYQRQPMAKQFNPYRNHPRDNVSWYQAVAFTRWLDRKYRDAGLLGTEVELRLPLETEWEYAARGTDGREYPYLGEFDPTKGNTAETGIGQTSAVGSFPDGASPFGALDMSGNVWEWCLNDYNNPTVVDGYGNGEWKVLRGGSFIDDQYDAAASFRSRYFPNFGSNYIGLRVVVAPLS